MTKVKAHELRTKDKQELLKQLEELKQELSTLRIQKASGTQKVLKISQVRKSIARCLTVIHQKQRDGVKELYKGKKLPLDLREKKTRAIRRRLSKEDAARMTLRQKKKMPHTKLRKYAVRG